jgi:thiamine-phosphate pyrophosphorylase
MPAKEMRKLQSRSTTPRWDGFLMAPSRKRSEYRAIDANLNRAVEGIRVAEDILRFERDNATLASEFRALRHSLRGTAALLPGGTDTLVSARDSRGDVARNAPSVITNSAHDAFEANVKRAQEATRVLEELSKSFSAAAASRFGEIRFKLYDLEKAALESLAGVALPRPIPDGPFLYAVAGYEEFRCDGSFLIFKEALSAGAGMTQLRDKHFDDKTLLSRAKELSKMSRCSKTLFVVNDRVDVALAAGADAVHLGQEDIPVAAARDIAGEMLRIGFSTHSYPQAMKALETRPDYISVGPIFESRTKPGKKPVGVGLIERVSAKANGIPIVAIGGITTDNISDVFNAGASGAAIISAITGSRNPKNTFAEINKIAARFINKASGNRR